MNLQEMLEIIASGKFRKMQVKFKILKN